ncbi:unnamed protein product, partial [Lymnaea stagnalis]
MTTSVLRIKRRIDEDPAEALIVSCKRKRHTATPDIESIFSFAGTINSKNDPVSRHIKEAIKQKNLLSHKSHFKHPIRKSELTTELRKEKEQTSRANRLRITCSRRTLDLDLLDDENEINKIASFPKDQEAVRSFKKRKHEQAESKPSCQAVEENKENNTNKCNALDYAITSNDSKDSSPVGMHLSKHQNTCLEENDSLTTDLSNPNSQVQENVICIYDVENDEEDDTSKVINQQLSPCGITLNNVPMVSKRVMSPPKNEREFVYDLYYAHNNLSDLDMEAVLTVTALCDDFVNDDNENNPDRELVHDESDDSNSESNWRNDYPDEDPHFFENEDAEYGYTEDMVDTNFLNDDDGDLLAYWMNTRCKV